MAKPGTVDPHVQAFLLADHIYRDKATEKTIIAGTFNTIVSREFPTVRPESWAYLAIRNVAKPINLSLVYKNEAEDSPFWRLQIENVRAPDRFTTIEFGLLLPQIAAPAPGKYSIDLFADESLLGSLKIEAKLQESQ